MWQSILKFAIVRIIAKGSYKFYFIGYSYVLQSEHELYSNISITDWQSVYYPVWDKGNKKGSFRDSGNSGIHQTCSILCLNRR